MNVVIASHDLYPDPGSGGTGRYVYETARRLVNRGHDVSVVTRRRGEVPRRNAVEGVDVYRYDLSVADRPGPAVLAALPRAYRRIKGIAAGLDPDVVSFQGPLTATLLDLAVSDDIPRSCTFHSPWPTEYRIRTRKERSAPRRRLNAALRERFEARLLAQSDEVVTLSESMHDRLIKRYRPAAKTAVVPGGVDAREFTPAAGDYEPIAGEDTVFLTVRRLSPRMGHGLLLEAFARVHERHPDTRLFIAGDGPLRDRLGTRVSTLDIDDATTFLGYVPDEDLPAVYATADVFVLPTTQLEGFGLATLEALAAGTPVVGTPVGGTPELLADCQSHAGIPERMLVSAAEPDALATWMDAWATLDPAERARAGRTCRRYAREQYTWESTVDALEERYRTLVEGDRGGRVEADVPPPGS